MTCPSNKLSIAVDPSKPGRPGTSTPTLLFSLALNDASRSRSPSLSGARYEPSFRGHSPKIAFYPTHLPNLLEMMSFQRVQPNYNALLARPSRYSPPNRKSQADCNS